MIPNLPIMVQVDKNSLFDLIILPYNEVSIEQKVKIVQLDPMDKFGIIRLEIFS